MPASATSAIQRKTDFFNHFPAVDAAKHFIDASDALSQKREHRVCKLADLRALLERKFMETYYSQEQAVRIVDVLMYAEETGKDTQGVLKLSGTEPMQEVKPKYLPKVVKETNVSAFVDGGGNPAILVCRMANEIAIQKCKESGIAIVGTHNTFCSSGAIGYYVEEMAKSDSIGIVFAGSPGGVSPFGSLDPLLGTNPMAFGFPTMNDPVIFDTSTAAITWYGLVRAQALGEDLPEGLTIDKDGNPTTDPNAAMQGAILPFDKSYKGSGMGLVVEILTGALSHGTSSTADRTENWSSTFIAIDPDLLVGKEAFKQNCTQLIQKIKNSRKAKGFDDILIPGEKGARRRKHIEQTGEIVLEERILLSLNC